MKDIALFVLKSAQSDGVNFALCLSQTHILIHKFGVKTFLHDNLTLYS